MLVVLVFVPAGSEFGHPPGHLFEPLQSAHDLPEHVALLYGLYAVVAADVYAASGGLQHVALYSPLLRLLLSL
jgi:hypothetical protein